VETFAALLPPRHGSLGRHSRNPPSFDDYCVAMASFDRLLCHRVLHI